MSLGRSAGTPPGGQPAPHGSNAGWRSQPPVPSAPPKPAPPLQAWARSILDDLVTTVFPSECRICNSPLLHAGTLPVCEVCIAHIHAQTGPLCRVCGEALGMGSERFREGFGPDAHICTPCRRVPPAFLRASAFGVYETELREMVQLLKYDRIRSLAVPLGSMLARAIEHLHDPVPSGSDLLVVAVPLFRAKQRGRGFNHAELIAAAAIRSLRRSHPQLRLRSAHHLLERVRETESQFALTPHARRVNLRGAFAVSERSAALINGRDVLLVDDIYTTGATARACAEVLRKSGARTVTVATVARAQVESVALWDASAPKYPAPQPAQQFAPSTGGHR